MKTENIFRYISYGLIAIGIAAIALRAVAEQIAFNPGSSQATKNSTTETSITFNQSSSTSSRKRHKINLNISNG